MAEARSQRVRIVIPGDEPRQIAGSPHLERLVPYGDVVLYDMLPRTVEEQLERVRDAEVILNSRGAVKWRRETLETLPRLRMLSLCSVGLDSVDLEAAEELGVVVAHQQGRTAPVVAEHEFALMLAVAKRLAFQTAELKAGRWDPGSNITLRGKTLGIIGTGATGAEMARLAQALGMEVVAWTFHPSEERARSLGVRYVELDDLLQTADVVSLHVALTADTRHLLGREQFARMKRGAILINGARGAVVDSQALVQALASGHLAGAGLDVFEQEPIPPDHPFLALDQVVLTPHNADATPEGVDYLNADAVDNIIAFLEGQPKNLARRLGN
jgi:D-3-phosphoglycerate dehydrogenase